MYDTVTQRDLDDAVRRATDDLRYDLQRRIESLENEVRHLSGRQPPAWEEIHALSAALAELNE